MNRKILAAIMSLAFSSSVMADDLADMYFTGKNKELSQQEKDALAIAKRWEAGSAQNIKPVAGKDGAIQFPFGTQQVTIVCAVLQVCDIGLQPGEVTTGLHPGDPSRWTFEPAMTGEGGNQVQHIIVKPLDVGLETTLNIPTNRRMYHLKLISDRTQFMPYVTFTYPEVEQAKWQAVQQAKAQDRAEKTIPQTGEYLGDLNFDYKLSGKASWKPVRVYNDGVKTIIQMPKSMSQTESPTLLVLRGGSEKDSVIVNYRVQGDRYIVDTIFDKAILIAGVGRKQDKITITKGK